ncbi:MAG: glycosyltransferase family 39 protein [Planctomycetes bacterium]|nr:glycosyltransferase family 39 protein [Planctomycetota bacterium]
MRCARPPLWIVLCLVGLVLRGALAFSAPDDAFYAIDGHEYREIAEHLARGEGFSITSPRWFEPVPPAGFATRAENFRPPLFPLCAAALFALPGRFDFWARGLVALLGALSIPLVYALARRVFDVRVAAIAAVAWTFYPPACLYAARFSTEGLAMLLLGIAALLALPRESPRPRTYLVLGAYAGLAILARANLAAPLGVLFLWCARRDGTRALVPLLIGLVAALAPWTFRNARCLGAPTPLPAFAGYNAWLGMNEQMRAMYGDPLGGEFRSAMDRLYRVEAPSRVRELERRGVFDARAIESAWWTEAARYQRERPLDALAICGARALHFVSPIPMPAVASLRELVLAFATTGFALLLALFALLRDPRAREPVFAALCFGGLIGALPFVFHLRLRFPIVEPLLVVLAARGAVLLLPRRPPHCTVKVPGTLSVQ